MFEDEEGARNIFKRWRERFGTYDKNKEISLSIIRQLPQQNKHHYCVLITSKLPESSDSKPNQIIAMTSRFMVMEPGSDVNLESFLEWYRHLGAFYLLPAFLNHTGMPEFIFDLAILKTDLTVKLAVDVSEHDIEAMALRRFRDV